MEGHVIFEGEGWRGREKGSKSELNLLFGC